MSLGPRWVWWLLGVSILAVLTLAGIVGSCERDEAGQRADSVLADTMVYVRTIARQDSTLAAMDSALARQERETVRVRDSAQRATRRGKQLVQVAEAVDAQGGLVPGISPHDSIVRLISSRAIWRTAALHYSQQVVPLLQRQIAGDSIWKLTALAKADTLTGQRDYARARAREITSEFQRYRDDSKPGLDLGLFRLSENAQKVVIAAVSVYAGCKAGGGC